MKIRPYWMLAANAYKPEDCAALIETANTKGWLDGTYSDGTKRDNVSVCFLEQGDYEVSDGWIESFRMTARILAPIFGVHVHEELLTSIQISRWREGDHYGMHKDHDTSGRLSNDRKLSLYASLSDNGGLDIDKVGHMRCNTGDALYFNSLVSHAAPKQETGERFSVVAWVPGPDWQ